MSTKLHIGLYAITSILLFLISYHFLQAEPGLSPTIQNSGWSEPETLFVLPDSTDGVRSLTASVNGEKLALTANLILRTPDFSALEFSYITKIESEIANPAEGTLTILSDTAYVAEGPTFLYHNKGEEHSSWHVLWGERRADPNFELWQWFPVIINLFSTTLVYGGGDIDEISPPVVLQDAGLSELGQGALRPAQFHIKEDSEGALHVVFQTWISDEIRGGEAPYITYIRKQPGELWEEPVFPVISEFELSGGIEPDIEVFQDGRILLSYIGSIGGNAQTINSNLLIITSDDQGNNWNAPESMFISERQPVLMQRIYRDAEGRVHLLWGVDHGGLPVVNEMWHRYSNDNGATWSSPEPFLNMSELSGDILFQETLAAC